MIIRAGAERAVVCLKGEDCIVALVITLVAVVMLGIISAGLNGVDFYGVFMYGAKNGEFFIMPGATVEAKLALLTERR